MKGLLIKDWYMTIKYCRLQLGVIVLMTLISAVTDVGLAYLMYPMLFAGMIPVYILSADEKDGWNDYVRTTPVTARTLVTEKYIVAVAAVLAAAVFMLLVWSARMLFGPADFGALLQSLQVVSAIGFVYPAIILPMILRFGVEKGRFIAAAGVVIVIALVMLFSGPDGALGAMSELSALAAVLPLAALILLVLSWLVAVRLYEARWAKG